MAILSNDTTQSTATTSCSQPAHLTNVAFAIKPSRHHQFLPPVDECTIESLKGYDHTQEEVNYYSSPDKVSTLKQHGGGSWLLGFTRLHHHHHRDTKAEEKAVTTVVSEELPALVRSTSSSSLESSDDASTISSSSSSKKKGVSFNPSVSTHHIPHASTYTPAQRRRMYSSSSDVRQNKIRNKKEFRYDGYDWRNCTEEWEMSVCMVTGELVHPVHSI